MLNMLNQYYDYLTSKLYRWLEQTQINNGDKYYLLLNDYDDVNKFVNSIKSNKELNVEYYDLSKDGLNYKPLSITINEMRIIFASNDDKVTADFLVTLRNRVGTDSEFWRNTALIFISSKALDSIIGGSTSLMRTGGPFHIQTLRKNLDLEVEESLLSFSEKKVLKAVIEETMVEGVNLTLNDFENIYSMLSKSKLVSKDFNNLGLFYDPQLETYKKNKEISERLSLNKELFEEVSEAHEHENTKDRLVETFEGDSIINELNRADTWQETLFEKAKKSYDDKEATRKIQIDFLSDEFKASNKNMNYWLRNDAEYKKNTATNRRTNHIIVFSETNQKEIKIKLPFDKKVSKNDVTPRGFNFYINNEKDTRNISYNDSGKNLVLEVENLNNNDIIFGEIKFKYRDKIQFRFYFLIVGITPDKLENIQPLYSLNVPDQVVELTDSIDKLQVGSGENKFTKQVSNKEDCADLSLDSNITYTLLFDNYKFESDDDLNKKFYLITGKKKLHFLIKEDKSLTVPRNSVYIDKQRREKSDDISYEDGKVVHGSSVYYPYERHKRLLELENTLIQNNGFFMDKRDNHTEIYNFKLPNTVLKAYLKLYNYLKQDNTLLSLENFTGDIHLYIKNIIQAIDDELSTLRDNQQVPNEIKNMLRIGTIVDHDNKKVHISPLNPIQIYYNFVYDNMLKTEDIHENILKKLSVSQLVPYVNLNGELFESYFDDSNYRWIEYQGMTNSNNKLSTYTRKIVMTKLQDYYKHFSYLFSLKDSEINIRLLNITDEKEILIGVVDFLLQQIDKKKDTYLDLTKINIFVEDQSGDLDSHFNSKFNLIYQMEDVEKFSKITENRLSQYSNLYFSEKDIMNEVKSKIDVFYHNEENENQQYHITFYRFLEQNNESTQLSDQLNRNYALNGLSSGKTFTKMQNHYVSGFGIDENEDTNQFINFINKWNSLLASIRNNGYENYEFGKVLVNNLKDIDAYLTEDEMNNLFNNSSWVSFINPDVDLRYFNDKNNELFVIHYSDQSNTQTYESITVTKEIEQYQAVLNEHLQQYTEKADDSETENIIRSFNLLNGEWLLRIIGEKNNNQNVVREKLSIIAGFKNLIALLDKPNIYWVPISLAEILRVSRMLGLDGSTDLFSAKMLKTTGETSDDLLFIGLEINDNDNLNMHFLPVEVKIGLNNRSIIEKAFNQVIHTSNILKTELSEADDEETPFTKKFYRNFFVQLYLANIEKILSSNLWLEKDYGKVLNYKGQLLDDNFDIADTLSDTIGDGVILSFETDNAYRKIEYNEEKNVSIVHLTESDAYDDVKRTIADINNIYKVNRRGISSHHLYRDQLYNYQEVSKDTIEEFDETPLVSMENNNIELDSRNTLSTEFMNSEKNHETESINEFQENNKLDNEYQSEHTELINLEDIRVLIGKVKGSNNDLYWEYGNKGLANRHLLITGKSGQGKTYFMQTLLFELSKNNISSTIIDYTNGFTLPQLEEPFKDELGDKLVNHFVYSDKLPVNPFAKFKMDIGIGTLVEQQDDDMIDRVVSVLDFVFNLGIQQKYSLKQVITEVYERYGENTTFTKVKEALIESESNTLLGRIDPLISRDPFTYENNEFNWGDIFNNKGEVHIFQLAGFQPQLQKVLTEFLLWDMYNYTTLNGSKNNPIPVLLDEAQNLNFKDSSPTTKIMKEGRKFGWSAWFATQSLSSIRDGGGDLGSLFNAAEQIHFQPTEDQVTKVANTLGSSNDKKYFENELSNLQKGEAMISGPALNSNEELISAVEVVNISSFEERN